MNDNPKTKMAAQVILATEQMFDSLVELQQKRLMKLAQELKPRMAPDDITDPQSFPEFAENPRFNYEEGYLQGLMAAQLEIRRAILRPLEEGRRPGV